MKLLSWRFSCNAFVFASLALSACSGLAQTEKPAEATRVLRGDPLHVFSESIQALTAKVTRSVVQIVATGYGLKSEKEAAGTALFEPQEAIGAGVILSADGYIVTNAHVVQGARKIRVRLPGLEEPSADESID